MFAALVVAANVLTSQLGLWPAGFGLMVTAGTYAAGLTFAVRDELHDQGGWVAVVGAIGVGALLSWWLAAPAVALASVVAFACSELLDALVYSPLRDRGRRTALVVSNVFGSVADTVLFLALASPLIGPFSWVVFGGQMLVKLGYCTGGYLLVREVTTRRRATEADLAGTTRRGALRGW